MTNTTWYNNLIGKVFDVEDDPTLDLIYRVSGRTELAGSGIYKKDCEILVYTEPLKDELFKI